MAARTLKVQCATWEQVDTFTKKKLRKGRLLSMKVPFQAKVGASVTLGLELPNQLVLAIDGVVKQASVVEGDATKTWIELELVGFTDEVMQKIRAMAGVKQPEPVLEAVPPAPVRKSEVKQTDDLPGDERELFQHLSSELRRLRQAAVHEVLGVAREAEADDVRRGWKLLVRRHHPDLVARRGAPAITHLAEELTILSNRAYDRMRALLAAEGRGALVGPTVKTPPGWLVGFEDLSSTDKPPPKAPERPRPATVSTPPANQVAAATQGGEAFEQRARAMLGQGDPNQAREVLAAALVVYPRSKPLRSLYYVATALAALQEGEIMLATAQLETALAHHEQCIEAAKMLEHIKKHGTSNPDAMQRLFR